MRGVYYESHTSVQFEVQTNMKECFHYHHVHMKIIKIKLKHFKLNFWKSYSFVVVHLLLFLISAHIFGKSIKDNHLRTLKSE